MINSVVSNYISKNIPTSDRALLTHKNVFIMPTRFGALFLGMLAILFVLGTNYQNNPILLLSYFLLGVLFWALFQCFFNLYKTQFEVLSCQNHFLGEQASFILKVTDARNTTEQPRVPLQLQVWIEQTDTLPQKIHNRPGQVRCQYTFEARGHHTLPTIKIRTEFPFGLIQAWTYLRPKKQVWVYPKPQPGSWNLSAYSDEPNVANDNHSSQQSESSERQFDGIRSYIPGSPMSQVAWKQYAKQQQGDYLLKDFVGDDKSAVALTLNSVPVEDLEAKLSILTQACIELHRDAVPFALNLEGFGGVPKTINTAKGELHLETCHKALASYAQRSQ